MTQQTSCYPWQTQQWQTLWIKRQEARLPPALILTGAAGLGKSQFARQLAQAILCEKQMEFACGQCRHCHLFQSNNHPDLIEITPEEKTKFVKIDQIRELTASLNQTAQLAGIKVVILNPANRMNLAAANALLKTLEEPMGRVIFLLVCDQLGEIPATIISRCQILRFSCPEPSLALDWLSKQMDPTAAPELLLKIADGAPLLALSLVDKQCLVLRDQLLQQLIALNRGSLFPIEMVSVLLTQDHELILHLMLTMVADLLRLKLGIDKIKLVHQDCWDQLQWLNSTIKLTALLNFLDELQQSRKRLLTASSVNVQLLLEGIILRWCSM